MARKKPEKRAHSEYRAPELLGQYALASHPCYTGSGWAREPYGGMRMSMWNPNSFEDIARRDAFESSVIEFGGGVFEFVFAVAKIGLPILAVLAVASGFGVHVTIGDG